MATLNDGQLAAIKTAGRHVLVRAGAGTGKTTTIVGRCSYLIESGVDPSSIQILTFTRRAAREVQHRVEEQLGEGAYGLNSSTFHAWCMSLIRGNEKVWGYEAWTIIDGDDQELLFRGIRGNQERGFPNARQIASAYSFSRNSGVGFLKIVRDRFQVDEQTATQRLVPIARSYESKKRENRYLDYDDILVIVGQQLGRSPEIAKWVGKRFPYLLVDEMQDTNPIQWDILLPLVPYASLYCVGDDAQSIYGFRGASFENIHHFEEVIPNSEVLNLTLNYRSTQPILDLSNWLLSKSPIQYNKHLESSQGAGDLPEVWDFQHESAAASWITSQIERAEKEDETPLKENLILGRAAWQAKSIEASLLRRNIPYQFYGGQKLLESAHIKDLLSALRITANPFDTIGWLRFLTLYPGIGDVKAGKLLEQELIALEQSGEVDYDFLPQEAAQVLKDIKVHEQDVPEAINAAIGRLAPVLKEKYSHNGWDRRAHDFPVLSDLARGNTSILGFIEQYNIDPIYSTELTGQPTEDAVRVATIHSAKGMEADNVFVVQTGPGQYPTARSLTEGSVEEERRALYVAMTRARKRLALTRVERSSFVAGPSSEDEAAALYFLVDVPKELWEHHGRSIPSLADELAFKDGFPPNPIDLGVKL